VLCKEPLFILDKGVARRVPYDWSRRWWRRHVCGMMLVCGGDPAGVLGVYAIDAAAVTVSWR
jgi:hypothetical protein